MMISILRNSASYFKSFRTYFILIYSGFIPFLAREAIVAFAYDRSALVSSSTQLMIAAGIGIAIVWGHLCTRLYLYPEKYSVKDVFSYSKKPAHLLYQFYLGLMTIALVVTWFPVSPSWFDTSFAALYPLEGGARYNAVGYQLSYLALMGAIVVVPFIIYPNYVLFRLRSQLNDKEVRIALKTFAIVFGAISFLLLTFHAIGALGVSLIGLGDAVDVILLTVVVRAFRKPSFLKAFLGVVPSFVATDSVREDQTVILYGDQLQKFGPFSRFILEGINKDQQVVCFYAEEEGAVAAQLDRNGVNVSSQILKGNLRLLPIQSLYQRRGYFDDASVLSIVKELEEEARSRGKGGLRILLDYGNDARQPMKKFLDHLTDPRWIKPDHFIKVLMALDKEAVNSTDTLSAMNTSFQVLDLAETPELFSRTLGLTHSQITGRKILLEYDPLSEVDKILRALVAEAASNLEKTIIFTRTDGLARSLAGNEPGLKTLLLTTRVSKPSIEKENLVLLPAYDTSLILDSLDKTIETYAAAPFTVVFDNITHMIFMLGQERAYGLVRQSLELMASDRITAVFLLNIKAHDQKTISSFENLFDIEIESKPEARVPEVRKKVRVTG